MKFEWDEQKRRKTLVERGVDFATIEHLDWNTALTAQDTRQPYSEVRYVTMGFIGERLHICAWCYREGNIRIISLRKANKREVKRYDQS